MNLNLKLLKKEKDLESFIKSITVLKTTNTICSFHRKKDAKGKNYNCKALVYAVMSEGKLIIRKIQQYHTHSLMTLQAIKVKLGQSQTLIPEIIRETSYRLFISGESTSEIYNLMKKTYFHETNCPFTIDPLRNYLYNKSKQECVNYEKIHEIYQKFNCDEGIKKFLIVQTIGENDDLKGLAFTFKEQIDYGNNYFILTF